MIKPGRKTIYPGGVFVWQKQKSTIPCKCGCGQFITNRSAKKVEQGNKDAGYVYGHSIFGKARYLRRLLAQR